MKAHGAFPGTGGLATHSCRDGRGQPSAPAPCPSSSASSSLFDSLPFRDGGEDEEYDSCDARAVSTQVSSAVAPLGLCVFDQLVTVDGQLCLRVANLTKKRVIIKRSSCVAHLDVLEEAPTNQVGSDECPVDPETQLPKPLADLLNQCDQLNSKQREQVRQLLMQYKDIFSCQGEIGHCKLVEHSIDTGDHQPIKQAPRRLDFHKQGVAGTCIQDMLEK